ncbi:MAG TPA: glutaredoxin family protein [Candidatus Tectomicrobia bacterium]|nr:glutaredoxin family protein [Candidatus Tectomicrobia bacterium]
MTPGDQGAIPRLTFYTKSDCALCHEAKTTLLALQRELAFEIEEIDITAAVGTAAEFFEEIPVGYLDGRKVFKHRVDPALLRRQLQRRGGWLMGRWVSHLRS